MKKITSKSLSQRLVRYGALTAAIGGIAETNGQVVYTDITDSPGNGTSVYDLNLDGDGTIDFQIYGSGGVQILADAMVLNGSSVFTSNSIAGALNQYSASASFAYPFALEPNTAIGPSLSWQAGNGQILRYINSSGSSCQYVSNWCDNSGSSDDITDKYLGLKFKIGTEIHYGWVRLDIIGTDNVESWLVKDYAYESIPDAPITTGDTGNLSVEDSGTLAQININVTDSHIELTQLTAKTNYTLYALTGQRIVNGNTSNTKDSIEIANLNGGIYILELGDVETNAVFRKKY
jgi:hypothetical protein